MSQKKYWKSFGEQQQSDEYLKLAKDEFREELPFESFDSKGLLDAAAPRRDFLKYLGFSTAAAALVAGCKQPVKKAIPYAVKPDNMVPGVADYYATTWVNNGEAIPVIAKVRDGRPIKIEGNKLCGFTGGGTSARIQASVLDLYDMSRLRMPVEMTDGGKTARQIPTWDALDTKMTAELGKLAAGQIAILSGTVNSETTLKIIGEFITKYPGTRHVQYDGISYSGLLDATMACYGQRVIPGYRFDKADVIVSLGADFLGTWVSPVEYARQYAQKRKMANSSKTMSKHFQFESFLSMTGANADERAMHLPSQTAAVANALLGAVNTGGTVSGIADKKLAGLIGKAGKALAEAKGRALVVSGSNDVAVQTIVHAINNTISATIDWAMPNNSFKGSDADMEKLVADMNAGTIKAVLIQGVNPAYTWPNGKAFADALAKVPFSVSFSEKQDETASLCKYIAPDHHYLESWGDAQPKPGYTSFIQPAIHPLFKTRNWQTSLLKWMGNNTDYAVYFKNHWVTKLGGQAGFDKALQTGIMAPPATETMGTATYNGSTLAAAAAAPAAAAGKYEVVLYQKVSIGDGRYANNPWLQEMPDPITKATWDNYIVMGAKTADDLGINFRGSNYEYHPEKPVYKITFAGGATLELPVLVIPGCAPNVLAIALGYGRAENTGIASGGAGKKVSNFASVKNGTVNYTAAATSIEKAGGSYKVAQNQLHNYYEDRFETVKERTLKDVLEHPTHLRDEREKELAPYGGLAKFRKEGTIYPDHAEGRGIHWGMSVDLNSCTGCGACVVACNAENNVPVVGKKEVSRGHDMHWIRIDRYFRSIGAGKGDADVDEVDVVFNPTMCQHCDNAPCENVCPVAATNHSSEGLNQMTYNRCIGTRYCANNCPYKVRRFNWADYTGADSFPNNQDAASGLQPIVTEQMMDDLTRMVLNPDVTVRSRGVIEKCSFCVQRLQEGKLKAKKDNRPLKDDDIEVACAQACPTNAITFGNAADKNSGVSQMRDTHSYREYYVLEMLHVLPNVNYLAKIRNVDDRNIHGLAAEHHAAHGGGDGHGEHKKEEKAATH